MAVNRSSPFLWWAVKARDLPNRHSQVLAVAYFIVFLIWFVGARSDTSVASAITHYMGSGVVLFFALRFWRDGIDVTPDGVSAVGRAVSRSVAWRDVEFFDTRGAYEAGARLRTGEWVPLQSFFRKSRSRDELVSRLNGMLRQHQFD